MVKKPEEKPNKVKTTLGTRVELPTGGHLSKDVKTPKWLRAIGEYFKGAVTELKQVKWPTRKASLNLTLAVILFTAVMSGFILALDYGFEQLFKQVIL